jgi:putative ABC transport system substrate-binding protein
MKVLLVRRRSITRACQAAALAAGFTVGLLAEPLFAAAQPAEKASCIGFFSWLGCSDDPFLRGPFRDGLRELGYVEGWNVVIECRSAQGRPDRWPALMTELVRRNVDVLVAIGTDLALVAKQTTTKVPIVIVYIADPVASGLVSSLARPGANVTGLSMLASEMSQKNLEVLKEVAPSISRVTVLLDSRNPGQALPYQQLAAAAKVLGVTTQHVDVQGSADLDVAFGAVVNQRAQALFVYPLPITPAEAQRLVAFAVKNRATGRDPPLATCEKWAPAFICHRRREATSARGGLCRPDPQGRQASGLACRAAREVRPDDQSQDRESAGAPDATVSAYASR